MAETMTAPVTETMVIGDPAVRSKVLWLRELLKKAQMGFASGATKVRVLITRAANSTAAAALAAGAQIGLATRTGWNGGVRALTGGLGLLARGAIQIARAVSWVGHQVGRAVSWFVGLFNKNAGANLKANNQRFTDWRTSVLSAAVGKVHQTVFLARAAMTTKFASNPGRIVAGTLGIFGVANLISRGAVASHMVGYGAAKFALLLGPIGLLATAAVAVVGGLFAWLFRRQEVDARAYEMLTEAHTKEATLIAEQSEPVFDGEVKADIRFNDAGEPVIDFTGSPEAVAHAKARSDVIAGQVVDAQMKSARPKQSSGSRRNSA